MKNISFVKTGDDLFVEFIVRTGVLAASYSIALVEAGTTNRLDIYKGDNSQASNDKFRLPQPALINANRKLDWAVDFKGLDLAQSTSYVLSVVVYQGNTILGEDTASGTLSGTDQRANGLIILKTA